MNFQSVARHGMIKQLVALNTVIFGGYCLSNGPVGLMYKKYLTLDASSSFLSLPLCHFGHTNPLLFLANSAALWTFGHRHMMKYGCSQFVMLWGASAVAASVLGVMDVRSNPNQVIAGGMAGTAGLLTYNAFANPAWFKFGRVNPLVWLTLLGLYGAFGNDKACVGGMGAGYLMFLMAL